MTPALRALATGDPTAMLDALDVGNRAAALEAGLTAYFGPAIHRPLAGVPLAVAALFTRFGAGLIHQNHLVDPRTKSRVFYLENQACARWSYTDDSDDSLVIRVDDDEQF